MNASALSVWIVDDDASIRWVLEESLQEAGLHTTGFSDGRAFLNAMEATSAGGRPDVVITDIRMPGLDGLHLLKTLNESAPELPVIVITAHSDLDSAVSAYSGGAFEYLPKPFDVDEAVALVRRAAGQSSANADALPAAEGEPVLIGRAPGMQEVFRAIGRLSRSSMTVLITGESGTGKELVAAALHRHSPRANGPFVALNTSAIPPDLLEPELFGHERGAFTGADAQRIGRFEQANGGTLFLDEIGDMSPGLQTRLLRVLAEGEFYRVGGQSSVKVDVRVIAATHQDLEARTGDGRFREDLFHRLNVIRIALPPLRDRREDIPLLLDHYLASAAAELGEAQKTLSDPALACLLEFDWPGNVRQLVNACRRLTALAPGDRIEMADLPEEFGGAHRVGGPSASHDDGNRWTAALAAWAEQSLTDAPEHSPDHSRGQADQPLLETAVPAMERTLIRIALRHTQGNRREAARILGWGRNTLTRKIRELELD